MRWGSWSLVVVVLATACDGRALMSGRAAGPSAQSPTSVPEIPPGVDPLTLRQGLGAVGLRRLSRDELRATMRVATGVDLSSQMSLLPNDPETPFDVNSADEGSARPTALVQGLESIASNVADAAMADASKRAQLFGCTPQNADDAACLRTFIHRVGRRVLRRPVSPAEVDELATAVSALKAEVVALGAPWDFTQGAKLVLRALLLDGEFIYRIEVGGETDHALIRQLDDYELASRLSFLLWGRGPDDALLDQAQSGALATDEGVRAVAEAMMADPRAAGQITRFHAMWLGYKSIPLAETLSAALKTEADALVERVVLQERRPWFDLLTSEETFVNAQLATHYGLTAPGGAGFGWVRWGSSGRRGILSQGSFLSAAAKFDDTSPVQRGLHVRNRLLCQEVPLPPPDPTQGVDVDNPPPGDGCKTERYAMHAHGGCAACHKLLDPIGFGLERYDTSGKYRAHDDGRPECALDGQGEVAGLGAFNGPGELGTLLAGSPQVEACVTTQVFRFAVGRPDTAADQPLLSHLPTQFRASGHRLHALFVDLAASAAFRHRVLQGN